MREFANKMKASVIYVGARAAARIKLIDLKYDPNKGDPTMRIGYVKASCAKALRREADDKRIGFEVLRSLLPNYRMSFLRERLDLDDLDAIEEFLVNCSAMRRLESGESNKSGSS